MTYSAKVGRKTLRSAPLLLLTKSLVFLPMISLCKMSPLSQVGVSISLVALEPYLETIWWESSISRRSLVAQHAVQVRRVWLQIGNLLLKVCLSILTKLLSHERVFPFQLQENAITGYIHIDEYIFGRGSMVSPALYTIDAS